MDEVQKLYNELKYLYKDQFTKPFDEFKSEMETNPEYQKKVFNIVSNHSFAYRGIKEDDFTERLKKKDPQASAATLYQSINESGKKVFDPYPKDLRADKSLDPVFDRTPLSQKLSDIPPGIEAQAAEDIQAENKPEPGGQPPLDVEDASYTLGKAAWLETEQAKLLQDKAMSHIGGDPYEFFTNPTKRENVKQMLRTGEGVTERMVDIVYGQLDYGKRGAYIQEGYKRFGVDDFTAVKNLLPQAQVDAVGLFFDDKEEKAQGIMQQIREIYADTPNIGLTLDESKKINGLNKELEVLGIDPKKGFLDLGTGHRMTSDGTKEGEQYRFELNDLIEKYKTKPVEDLRKLETENYLIYQTLNADSETLASRIDWAKTSMQMPGSFGQIPGAASVSSQSMADTPPPPISRLSGLKGKLDDPVWLTGGEAKMMAEKLASDARMAKMQYEASSRILFLNERPDENTEKTLSYKAKTIFSNFAKDIFGQDIADAIVKDPVEANQASLNMFEESGLLDMLDKGMIENMLPTENDIIRQRLGSTGGVALEFYLLGELTGVTGVPTMISRWGKLMKDAGGVSAMLAKPTMKLAEYAIGGAQMSIASGDIEDFATGFTFGMGMDAWKLLPLPKQLKILGSKIPYVAANTTVTMTAAGVLDRYINATLASLDEDNDIRYEMEKRGLVGEDLNWFKENIYHPIMTNWLFAPHSMAKYYAREKSLDKHIADLERARVWAEKKEQTDLADHLLETIKVYEEVKKEEPGAIEKAEELTEAGKEKFEQVKKELVKEDEEYSSLVEEREAAKRSATRLKLRAGETPEQLETRQKTKVEEMEAGYKAERMAMRDMGITPEMTQEEVYKKAENAKSQSDFDFVTKATARYGLALKDVSQAKDELFNAENSKKKNAKTIEAAKLKLEQANKSLEDIGKQKIETTKDPFEKITVQYNERVKELRQQQENKPIETEPVKPEEDRLTPSERYIDTPEKKATQQLKQDLNNPGSNWAVMEAVTKEMDPEEAADATRQLEQFLKDRNIPFTPSKGSYDGVENPSVMVHDVSPTKAMELSNAFTEQYNAQRIKDKGSEISKQEAVATSMGMLYQDGKIDPVIGKTRIGPNLKGGYTEVNVGGQKVRFQIKTDPSRRAEYKEVLGGILKAQELGAKIPQSRDILESETTKQLVKALKSDRIDVVSDQQQFDDELQVQVDKKAERMKAAGKSDVEIEAMRQQSVRGFVIQGSGGEKDRVFINPRMMNEDTRLHEFIHPWVSNLKKRNPALFNRAMTLMEGSRWHKDALDNLAERPLEEALTQYLGESTATKFQLELRKNRYDKLKELIDSGWNDTMKRLGVKKPKTIQEIGLKEFIDLAYKEVVKGETAPVEKIPLTPVDKLNVEDGQKVRINFKDGSLQSYMTIIRRDADNVYYKVDSDPTGTLHKLSADEFEKREKLNIFSRVISPSDQKDIDKLRKGGDKVDMQVDNEKDIGVLKRNGKRFWMGVANVNDGYIEAVITYERAELGEFRHFSMFNQNIVEKINNGEVIPFFFNNDGSMALDWKNVLNNEEQNNIKSKIYDQFSYTNDVNKEGQIVNLQVELTPKQFEENLQKFEDYTKNFGIGRDMSTMVGEHSRLFKRGDTNFILNVGSTPKSIKLETIYTSPGKRGQGGASRTMKELTDLADKNEVILELLAHPFEDTDMTKDELKDFYGRNGFVFSGDFGVRYPVTENRPGDFMRKVKQASGAEDITMFQSNPANIPQPAWNDLTDIIADVLDKRKGSMFTAKSEVVRELKHSDWYNALDPLEKARVSKDMYDYIRQEYQKSLPVSSKDAMDAYNRMVDQTDREMAEVDKRIGENLKRTWKKAWTATGVNLQGYLLKEGGRELGSVGRWAYDLYNLQAGSSAYSSMEFQDAMKSVYGGVTDMLSQDERKALSMYLQLNRIIEVDEIRDKKNDWRVKHTADVTKEQMEKYLSDWELSADPDLVAKVKKQAGAYYDVMHRQLSKLREANIINDALYQQLLTEGVHYSPRKFISKLESEEVFGGGITGSGIKALDEGSDGAMINDPSILLHNVIARTNARIARNKAAQALEEFRSEIPAQDVLLPGELTEAYYKAVDKNRKAMASGEKGEFVPPVYNQPPDGYREISWMKDGQKQTMYAKKWFAKEWDAVRDPEWFKVVNNTLGWVMGSKVLKMAATGYNPSFILTNTPLDIFHIISSTTAYNVHYPVAMAQMANDIRKVEWDVLRRGGRLDDFIRQGGSTGLVKQTAPFSQLGSIVSAFSIKHPWVSIGRALNEETRPHPYNKTTIALSGLKDVLTYLGETSELTTRLALRNRYIINGTKDFVTKNGRLPDPIERERIEIQATAGARDYLDFSQGGYATKFLESFFPYLNAGFQVTRGTIRAARKDPTKFWYKMFQVMGTSAALASWNLGLWGGSEEDRKKRLNNYLADVNNRRKTISWNIMTDMTFTDSEGRERSMYIKIPKDNTVSLLTGFVEDIILKAKYPEIDVNLLWSEKRLMELQGLMKNIGDLGALPPAAKAYFGYLANYDFYFKSPIYRKKMGEDFQNNLSLEYTKRTPSIYRGIGKLSSDLSGERKGLSPDRLQYAVEQFTTQNNPFYLMFENSMSALAEWKNPELGRAKKMIQAPFMENINRKPGLNRLMGVTVPVQSDAVQAANEAFSFKQQVRNRRLQELIDSNAPGDQWSEFFNGIEDIDEISRLFERTGEKFKEVDIPYEILSAKYLNKAGAAEAYYEMYVSDDEVGRANVEKYVMIPGVIKIMDDKILREVEGNESYPENFKKWIRELYATSMIAKGQ